MAEFVPDGHKYGIRWKDPWGFPSGGLCPSYVNSLVFTTKQGQALRLAAWCFEGGGATYPRCVGSEGPGESVAFFLFRESDSPIVTNKLVNTTRDDQLLNNETSAGEYLARVTASWPNFDNSQSTTLNFPGLCVEDSDASGLGFQAPEVGVADGWLDICVEFSKSTPVDIKSFSLALTTNTRPASGTADTSVTDSDNVFVYADTLSERPIGCGNYPTTGVVSGQTNRFTLEAPIPPSPMSCLYKDPSGALYQIDTSAYATQAEYQALLARVAALEAAKAGA